MRLVRLAAQLDFKIEGETAASAKANSDKLSDITTERKRAELDKILYADTANGVPPWLPARRRACRTCADRTADTPAR